MYLTGAVSGLSAVVVRDGYVGSRWKSALPYMMLTALTDVEAISLGIGVYVISFSVRRLECRWFARMLSAADSRILAPDMLSIWSIQ